MTRNPPHFSFFILKAAPFSGQGLGATVNRYTIIYKGDAKAINSNDTDPIGGYTQSNTAVSSVNDAIKTPNTYCYNASNGAWFSVDISLWSDYGTNKSIYDPCPYGYRVPINGSWPSSFTKPPNTGASVDNGVVWSGTWWGMAGYRNGANGTIGNVGSYGWYWSSTRHSNAYQSYSLYFDFVGYVYPSYNYYRSYAMSVRCVQERATFRMKNEK